jgi:hypothetical protein
VENLSNKQTMETRIKRNEPFQVLSIATGIPVQDLENLIVDQLIEQQLIEQHYSDFGMTIQQIMDLNDWQMNDFVKIIFPGKETNDEILQLIKAVKVWGNASGESCPECGCGLKSKLDSFDGEKWTEKKCENPNCDHATTGEPDWDSMSGGIDFDN